MTLILSALACKTTIIYYILLNYKLHFNYTKLFIRAFSMLNIFICILSKKICLVKQATKLIMIK